MKDFVKKHFTKANFVDVTFSDFKKIYSGKLQGYDITEVANELGINTKYKPKSVGRKKK